MRSGTFAAIDVGTTKTCTIVGDVSLDGHLRILGVGVVPSAGMNRGSIENLREATEAIHASVEKAERASGTRILSAHVGIAGSHISSLNNRGIVAVPDRQRPISPDDVTRALEGARLVNIPSNREVIHVIPRYFVVDGQETVSDPVGMYGQRLDVETHIVTGATSAIQNLTKAIESIGVQVDSLILKPLASADAVLGDEERREGVVLADIGGGTTDIVLFMEGSPYHSAILPIGGNHITRDLVVGLRVPFHAAETAKADYGHALPSSISPDEMVEVEAFGSERRRQVLRRRICEIIQARIEEILELIGLEIKRSGYEEMISAGLVLTGGTANLRGIVELAEQVTGLPVRLGYPHNLQGLADTLGDPAYSTGVGLLIWAVREHEALSRSQRPRVDTPFAGWLRRFSTLARILLPQ